MNRRVGVETVVLGGEVVVGVSDGLPDVALDDYDLLLTATPEPPRPWVLGTLEEVEVAFSSSPAAGVALAEVLRITEEVSVPSGVAVESLAYSTLQHGEVFERWLARRPDRARQPETAEPVRLTRTADQLEITLDRPHVHNALSAAMRDALCDAFDVLAADPSIDTALLRGAGPSFCSGGDLDEFGLATDAGAAHLIRVARSVGRRVHDHAGKVTAHLHGSCIGAGIEISAFAGCVLAAPDTSIRLPEVAMGLIPGAGGTVSIPRRIGRHRTAYLALTGTPIDAPTALAWGLVDEIL